MKEVEKLTPKQIEQQDKENFLSSFENQYKEDFLPKDWTEKQKARVLELTDGPSTKRAILTAIPMVCHGPRCDFAATCPLQQEGIAPINERCPIEFGIIRHFMSDLIEQLDVDINNTVEVTLLRDIVNQEVQMLRATKLLAQESFIQENIVGIDSEGEPIMRKELHLATELEDKIHKRRQILFKQFLATREAKAKVGLAAIDSAQNLSTLMHNFRVVDEEASEAVKRKMGYIDVDEYIEGKEAQKNEE